MNTDSAHSPLPWRLSSHYDTILEDAEAGPVISLGDNGGCDDPDCCGGATYYVNVSDADAEYIVRAVNAHQQLVDALQACVDAFDSSAAIRAFSVQELRAWTAARAALGFK